MYHRDAIGSLRAGAIEDVVEGWTLVRAQIQPGGVRHHPHAHVTREPVCKQGVEEMCRAPDNRAEYRQPAFEADEPPEVGCERAGSEANLYRVENRLRHPEHGQRQEGATDAARDPRRCHPRTGLPGQAQHQRHVAEGASTRTPSVLEHRVCDLLRAPRLQVLCLSGMCGRTAAEFAMRTDHNRLQAGLLECAERT